MTLWPWLAIAALLGLVFGSFLNVCIARLPQHRSIARPRSQCPTCGGPVRTTDNIPLLSWVLLRGRCRNCQAHISARYPLVELGLALLWVACAWHTGPTWATLVDAVACFFLLGLLVMDAETMLLPDAFTWPGMVAAVALRVAAPELHNRGLVALKILLSMALAALLLLLIQALYWLARRRQGMGWGDVKLIAMIAAFLGLEQTLLVYFLAIVSGAAFAIYWIRHRRVTGESLLPFGSFLCGAAIFTVFFGEPILRWYLGIFR
jgi:leader peptidase (prepilin peptidase)/N-methyltransferase